MRVNNTTYKAVLRVNHFALALFLGCFFIYAGIKKFIPKPPSGKPANNEIFIKAFEENKFEGQVTFRMAIKALKESGFMMMVGALQIAAGLLIIIPPSRLIGLLMLLPLTVNIFCFHLFMDNRLDENIETGLLLLINVILLIFYNQELKSLVIKKQGLIRLQK